MAHPGELAAAGTVFVVAAVAAVLLVITWRARQRTQSRSLTFVAAAFALFVVKGIVVGASLLSGMIRHEHLEVVSALFDLGIVVLLVWPLIR